MNEKADFPRAGKWFSANSYLSFIFRLAEFVCRKQNVKMIIEYPQTSHVGAGLAHPYASM